MATTISLVVPAAGLGARAALNGNKILAPLGGQPLLWHTLRALTEQISFSARDEKYARIEAYFSLAELIVAARDDERETIEAIWRDVESPLKFQIVRGGATRQESVASAARACSADLIAVHDAARPLVPHELLARVALAASHHGAAIPALVASDTVKRATCDNGENFIAETLSRETIYLAQTPQIFRRAIFLHAIETAERDKFSATDCASLVERLRDESGKRLQRVALVEGDAQNFKVTFAADLERAARVLCANELVSRADICHNGE